MSKYKWNKCKKSNNFPPFEVIHNGIVIKDTGVYGIESASPDRIHVDVNGSTRYDIPFIGMAPFYLEKGDVLTFIRDSNLFGFNQADILMEYEPKKYFKHFTIGCMRMEDVA